MLFKEINEQLINIKEKNFKLESKVQRLIEKNLPVLLDLDFLITEFSIDSYRFDSVAYNPESNAFVIIEYKKVRCDRLVDQGYAYLGVLLNRKAEFVLLYNRVKNESKQVGDFDWSQTRIVFISPKFNNYQLDATRYIKLPFDIYQIKKYEEGIVSFEKLTDEKTTKADSKEIIRPKTQEAEVMKEIVVYTEDDHKQGSSEEIIDLYERIKDSIMEWGDIVCAVKKCYIAFKTNKNFCDIQLQKNQLKIWLNLHKGQLNDNKGLFADCSIKGHWGNGDYEAIIKDDNQFEYLMSLIKQSWEANK